MAVTLELFYSPYCTRCHKARRQLRSVTEAWPADRLEYREFNVLEALDRAVALGVQRTPALVIDGQLVPGPVPSSRALENLVRQQLNGQHSK